jgi:hypothetical protein
VLAVFSLSGCMTGLGKTKVAETVADPKPVAVPMTPGEQLAAALNAKAAASGHKQVGYRDPMVRTASGHQIPLMASPGDKIMMAAANTGTPGIMSDAPTGIAGLVTQPTAVNANRTSIYSAGVSASAAQMPGQIDAVPQGAAMASPQGITPVMRSVYSVPASMMQEQQQPAPPPEPQGVNLFPAEQSSHNVTPQAFVQPAHTALPGSKPVSDATPSRMMPSPYTKGHTIDSKEALMIARNTASKQQQGESQGQGQAVAQRRIQIINQPMPQGMVPGVSMTPGMAASLKQPIAFKRGVQRKPADSKQDQVMISNLPVHL